MWLSNKTSTTQLNWENPLPFAFAFSLYGLHSFPGWRAPFDLKSQSNENEVTNSLSCKGAGEPALEKKPNIDHMKTYLTDVSNSEHN